MTLLGMIATVLWLRVVGAEGKEISLNLSLFFSTVLNVSPFQRITLLWQESLCLLGMRI